MTQKRKYIIQRDQYVGLTSSGKNTDGMHGGYVPESVPWGRMVEVGFGGISGQEGRVMKRFFQEKSKSPSFFTSI